MDIERDLEFARKCVMVSTADIVTKTRVDETLKAIARQSVKSEDVAEAIEYFETVLSYLPGEPSELKHRLAITALQAYQPWVSVDDRLPESGKDVLTIKSSGNCKVLRFETDCLWYDSYSEWDKGVTHWKPLPEPPKGE